MLLDDLVTAIQTVQGRIREHGNTLSQNEYRTRISLIDPVLNALGWDVSDPRLVTIEDQYPGGRPDYGLLGKDMGKSLAFIEAKRLGESLDAHQDQIFKYTWDRKVFYAGLTDGNRWILRDVAAEFSRPPREGLLLDVTISREPVHKCAIKLLLLWRHTLTDGEPLEANEPIIDTPTNSDPPINAPEPPLSPQRPPDSQPPSSEWISLSTYRPKESDMVTEMRLRFPDATEKQLKYWWDFQAEVAEWLIQTGALTAKECPVSRRSGWCIIHTEAQHLNGNEFFNEHVLSNGLFLEKRANRFQHVECTKFLLNHCGQDPATILLKPSQ